MCVLWTPCLTDSFVRMCVSYAVLCVYVVYLMDCVVCVCVCVMDCVMCMCICVSHGLCCVDSNWIS